MKNFKTFLLAAAVMATTTFTACNDDEAAYTYVPLTPQEQAAQINLMQGSYTGQVISATYSYTGGTVANDTSEISFTVRAADSTLVISNLPLKAFVPAVADEALKAALLSDGIASVSAHLSLYRPWGTEGALSYYYYAAVPQDNQGIQSSAGNKAYEVVLPLTIAGEEKDVTFLFANNYNNYIYSTGLFADSQMEFYFILKSITPEGGATQNVEALMHFYGKK